MIDIICATRLDRNAFLQRSAMGWTIRRYADYAGLKLMLFAGNTRGLPEIYNACIRQDSGNDVMVFVHDDVFIEDNFFPERIMQGLSLFDVVGVAGNRRRVPRQPSWAFVDDELRWDDAEHLSGRIAHGPNPNGKLGQYGPPMASCELLDGVLMATRRSALRDRGIRFDERFGFHFYDLDFCRAARAAGMTLGTIDLTLTHQSPGNYQSPAWRAAYSTYLDKWQA